MTSFMLSMWWLWSGRTRPIIQKTSLNFGGTKLLASPQPELWGGRVPPVPNGSTPVLLTLTKVVNNSLSLVHLHAVRKINWNFRRSLLLLLCFPSHFTNSLTHKWPMGKTVACKQRLRFQSTSCQCIFGCCCTCLWCHAAITVACCMWYTAVAYIIEVEDV